ncbi:MAG: spore coat U domain-containing protein [Betaproteobacteria bacterium]
MYKRTIGTFALAKALFVVLLTSAVLTRAAGTATGQFIVQATVNLSCSVASTENVNFGSIQSPTGAFDGVGYTATGSIAITCQAPTFRTSLNKGNGAGATFAQRKMTSTSNAADTLIYSLYLPEETGASTLVWGDGTEGSEILIVGGSGSYPTRVFHFKGVIAVNQAPAAGSYQDTIVVTVSF